MPSTMTRCARRSSSASRWSPVWTPTCRVSRPTQLPRLRSDNGERGRRGATAPPLSSVLGEADEVVERPGVRERIAAGGLLGRDPHQDLLDRDLEHFPREGARDLGDRADLARHVARRAVLADARADALDEIVVELGPLAE